MIFVLGSGWQQMPTIKALAKMGFQLVLIDKIEPPLYENLKFEYWKISITNIKKIKDKIKKSQIHPILFISPNTHIGTYSVQILSAFYGTPYLSENTNILANDKYKLQCFLKENEFCSTLAYGPNSDFNEINFGKTHGKFILKPRFGSGSRGVRPIHFKGIHELIDDTTNFRTILKNGYQLEYFISGREFSIECYMNSNGDLDIIAISERMLRNHVSAKSIIMIDDKNLFDSISDFVLNLMDKVPDFVGPVHLELIIDKNDIFVIDLGFRTGGYGVGDLLVRAILGYNLNVRWVHDLLRIEWMADTKYDTRRFGLIYTLPKDKTVDLNTQKYIVNQVISLTPNEEEIEADSARSKIYFVEVQ